MCVCHKLFIARKNHMIFILAVHQSGATRSSLARTVTGKKWFANMKITSGTSQNWWKAFPNWKERYWGAGVLQSPVMVMFWLIWLMKIFYSNNLFLCLTHLESCCNLNTIMSKLKINSFRNTTAAIAPQGMNATASYCVVNHEITSPKGRDIRGLGKS